jgi:hypothetical protein
MPDVFFQHKDVKKLKFKEICICPYFTPAEQKAALGLKENPFSYHRMGSKVQP